MAARRTDGTCVEPYRLVKLAFVAVLVVALTGCRGEPVPRDYQNAPPEMMHPPDSRAETPAAHGMGDAPPQPTTGVEGKTGAYRPATGDSTTTTIGDTPPTMTVTDTPPTTNTR